MPVRLGAILPTMAPGGVPRRWLVGAPLKLCEPPPCGWSTGFMATPRTRGHRTPLARMAWCFLPALRKGLSTRPAPATGPVVHGAPGDGGPPDSLGAHGVVLLAGLEEGLVAAAAAGHEADGGAREGVELAELARGHADDGLARLGVGDDL